MHAQSSFHLRSTLEGQEGQRATASLRLGSIKGSEVNDLTTEGGEAPVHAVPSTPITGGFFSTGSAFIERRINSSRE